MVSTRNRTRRTGPAARQRGVTLIETLIAILLFSIGLLGLVGLQARATQVSIGAEDSNRAALLANDIATEMLTTNTLTLPAATLAAWDARVAAAATAGLPNGAGTVAVDAGVATITVTWRAPNEPDAASHRYVTQVVLP